MTNQVSGPSSFGSHLTLIASTVLATLAIRRHLEKPAAAGAAARPAHPVAAHPALLAGNPLSVLAAHGTDILRGTYNRINRDRILATAAGVVFYGLLALFPAITALVSIYGMLADPSTIGNYLQSLAVMLPADSFSIVQDEVARVLAKPNATLSVAFVFGFLLAIWSSNAGVKAVLDALNVAYEVEEERGLIRLNLESLAFTIAGLAAVLLMVGAVVGVPLLLERLGLGNEMKEIVQIGRWPVLGLALLIALLTLYGYGPSRPRPKLRWLVSGAVLAIVLWLIGSELLSLYLSDFANYSATYGSLGAAIGLMTWMWLSAIVILVGAELNSEVERWAGTGSCSSG